MPNVMESMNTVLLQNRFLAGHYCQKRLFIILMAISVTIVQKI